MIKSMTAFGRGEAELEGFSVLVEIKSVNSRFFDCAVKLPRAYLYLEEKIKSYVQKNGIGRGKVDVFITIRNSTAEIGDVTVDFDFAEKYIGALKAIRDRFSLPDDITAMAVAKNPEVIKLTPREQDEERDWELIQLALTAALDGHGAMRCSEGDRIKRDIASKLENIRAMTIQVGEISKSDIVGYRDKLEERIRKILQDNTVVIDENRILTECAVFADKIAIDEELVRLSSHFDAFYEILELNEPSGRKLDFLVQELNRETNTIGSKCNNAAIARIVVDMKGEIEKIREQIQNIE